MVDRNDVARVVRRADLVHRLGHQTVPVVAGEDVTQGGSGSRSQSEGGIVAGRTDVFLG